MRSVVVDGLESFEFCRPSLLPPLVVLLEHERSDGPHDGRVIRHDVAADAF